MLRRRIAVAFLTVSAVLLPVAAYAAITNPKLQQLLTIVQNNKRSVGATMELKVDSETFSAQVLVDGRSNGQVNSLKDVQADINYNISLSMDDNFATVKGQLRLVNATGYLLISDVNLTGEFASAEDEYKQFLNQWISFPLDPSEYEELNNARNKNTTSLARFDRFFYIRTIEDRGTVRYEVTLPANKQRAFLSALLGVARTYSPGSSASARRMLRSTKVDINLAITTLLDNTFESFDSKVTVKTKVGRETVDASYEGNWTVLTSFTPVTVPTGSKTFEELLGASMGAHSLDDARDAQRRSDANTILNAIYQYAIDHDGNLPAAISVGKVYVICKTDTSCDGISLNALKGSYLIRIPSDPEQDPVAKDTGYTVETGVNGRVTIKAPRAAGGPISVTR